ncbi:MAG: amidase [Alphaproteobacteria bacterium]|jgi:Asp-tRNA(Asn)/Glu-tRNA(Gln) amidotransferase A subunit family amidase
MTHHLESATDLVAKIKTGELTSQALVRACLERIEQTDGAIRAWQHLDEDLALAQAKDLDELRANGKPMGPLHGIPVGIKDIVDTADMPTEYGSPIHAGHAPAQDATLVAKLREAGAVIMGKTVTTEFAFMFPGKTTNPHNGAHTPGGSSSGSAAAVAAGHVPLAVGSQTAGSVIRPASFCGVYGLKPSQGMISRKGVLQTAKSLDQIGVFGRCLEDVALLADALGGHDAGDEASHARAKPDLSAGARAAAPVEPTMLWFELPFEDRLDEDAAAGFGELREALGDRVERVVLPESLGNIIAHHRVIHHYELRRHLASEFEHHADLLSPFIRDVLQGAADYDDNDYAHSLEAMASAKSYFAEFFNDYDAILTPAATGQAPLGLERTGDPIFCTLWTFCGLPSLTLPLLEGAQGLPIGVQLVAGLEEDDRLCRTARWLLNFLDQT